MRAHQYPSARPLTAFVALFCLLGITIGGGLFGAGPSARWQVRDATGQSGRPPRFRAGTHYVSVDVYPTKDGAIVPDLAPEDFEVFEDGVRQTIEAFDRIVVTQRTTAASGREPNSVAESRALAADPDTRVFVLFLDTYHTRLSSSRRVRTALASFLERVLGPDDLVGVMTPEMSAAGLTLARRTEVLAELLQQSWAWGRRDNVAGLDPEEMNYEYCFPERDQRGSTFYAGVAREMIERRRELLALSAVEDLVRWLEDVRGDRKAVITVSEGWRLFRPNDALLKVDPREGAPTPSRIGVDPQGRLTSDRGGAGRGVSLHDCERDRQRLAAADTSQQFRDLLGLANRASVTFYPVDPRGLPVFDTSIEETRMSPGGLTQPLAPPSEDAARLSSRLDSLRTLAAATDGLAVVDSHEIERGLTRIVADMTTYYLLGYYATNSKLDGSFRSIRVRVTRPGVQVRARRGYRAPTSQEMEASAAAAAPVAAPSAFDTAMAGLAATRGATGVTTHLAWTPAFPGSEAARLWATVELDTSVVKGTEWAGGGTIDLTVADAMGAAVALRREALPAGERVMRVEFTEVRLPAGDLTARLRLAPAGGGLPLSDVTRLPIPAPSARWVGEPRLWRRNQMTGPRFVPTADRRFRRSERFKVELEVPSGSTVVAEVLDRRGTPFGMEIPFTARPSADSSLAASGVTEVAAAPFAAGDYALRFTVESAGGRALVFVPFRIVP